MAQRAPDVVEGTLTRQNRSLDGRIIRDELPGHRKSRLPYRHCGDVGPGHLVDDAIAVRIGSDAKPLRRLDAVVLVERCVRDVSERDDASRLAPRPDQKARRARRRSDHDTRTRQPLHSAHVPGSIAPPRERAERHAFCDERS